MTKLKQKILAIGSRKRRHFNGSGGIASGFEFGGNLRRI